MSTMPNFARCSLLLAAAVAHVSAQSFVSDPLVDKSFPYTAIVRRVLLLANALANI